MESVVARYEEPGLLQFFGEYAAFRKAAAYVNAS